MKPYLSIILDALSRSVRDGDHSSDGLSLRGGGSSAVEGV